MTFFPKKTIDKMSLLGLSESEVFDVFNTGEYGYMPGGAKKATKKFNGYEIGLTYDMSPKTGEYSIISVWKRERK